jgi:hypothetical protein
MRLAQIQIYLLETSSCGKNIKLKEIGQACMHINENK